MAPVDLTFHYQNPYLRAIPHYRTYFPALLRSSNPFTTSFIPRPRRLAFLLVLLMRSLQTAYYLFLSIMGLTRGRSIWLLVFICVVAFTIELWNLHLLVEAEGDGTVLGKRVPAGVFGVFVFMVAVWNVCMVPLEVSGIAFYIDGKGTLIMEGIWVATTCCLAWVAHGEREEAGVVLT